MVLLFAIFAIATTASAVQDASLETSAEAALRIGDSHLRDTTYASAEPFYRQSYTLVATKLSAGHFMAKAMLRRWNKMRELNGNKNAATDEDAPGVSTGVNTALNKSTVPLIWHCTNETIAKYSATHHLSGTTCVKHTVCDGASTDEVAGNATTDTTCPCAAGYHSETTVDNIQTCEECAAGYTCAGGAAAASLPTPPSPWSGWYCCGNDMTCAVRFNSETKELQGQTWGVCQQYPSASYPYTGNTDGSTWTFAKGEGSYNQVFHGNCKGAPGFN